ncbi:phosphotransferase family protein [Gordonia alkanivorans]|uniref:phosphotransferase family protein n=1 Tax=Gordonia alkanivorans TaxID=84096 RepID=UPI00244D203E|nr:phosphotransferase family protein [Gordonia alkanivorans]MDH3047276.1 phosphotransferase family protein [Gordonia alkanivorans]
MTYTPTRGDLGSGTHEILARWIPTALPPTARDVSISDFSAPDAGYSGKTVFFTATWTDDTNRRRSEPLVLRMQATDHQLFTTPDAPRQAEIMQRLARHRGIAVPEVKWIERDPSVLGAPFYLMYRIDGRTPSDVPSWHKRGWVADLDPAQRSVLCDNALRSLVALHSITDAQDLAYFRGAPDNGSGSALARYLRVVADWYSSIRPELVVGADVLARAMATLDEQIPPTTAERIVWGDARVGNVSFGDDLSVAAMFDWETATTGPPEIDLGWWLMFENFLCEALGFERLDGAPDTSATVARYQALGGVVDVENLPYYKLLAAFVLSLINNRLAVLLIRDGLDPATARGYPLTSVRLADEYLHEIDKKGLT